MNLLQGLLKFLFYCAVGAVICIAGAAYFFMTWEPDRKVHPFRGIDVSHHNGEIDWHRVAGDDVSFVYMKASEGKDFTDSSFAQNWREAGEAGLARGAYHFFSFCSTGREQAQRFLSVVPKDDQMLPPVVDLEFEGNCNRRPSTEEFQKEIADFVVDVEQGLRRRVMFYVPKEFYEAYLSDLDVNRPVWVRSIWRHPLYNEDWTIWQYHQRGKVKGINGDVDLNVLSPNKTLEELTR